MKRCHSLLILALGSFSACGSGTGPGDPGSTSDWTKVNTLSETGSAISFSDIFFLDPETGWATGNNNFLAKTTDAGKNWSLVQPENEARLLGKVVFLSTSVGFVICVQASDASEGIYRTTDGGATWTQVAGAYLGSQYIAGLQDLHFMTAETGIATGLYGTILRTSDGGVTWTRPSVDHDYTMALPAAQPVDFYSEYFLDENTGYISGTAGTVLKTTDAGATWLTVTSQPFSATTTTLGATGRMRSIRFLDATKGFVATDFGLFETPDGGSTWTRTAADLIADADNDLRAGARDASTLYVDGGSTGMIKTSDAGATWIQETIPSTIGPTSPLGFTVMAEIAFSDARGWAIGGNGEIYTTP